jgi:hypothetical protein
MLSYGMPILGIGATEDRRSAMAKRRKVRLPAETCVVCGLPHRKDTGARIVAGLHSDVSLDTQAVIPYWMVDSETLCRARRLPRKLGGGVLMGCGKAATREALDRAQQAIAEGLRPWICQKCDGPLCPECGAVLTVAVARDVIDDNGEGSHVPVIAGFAARCSNPECDVTPPKPVLTVK